MSVRRALGAGRSARFFTAGAPVAPGRVEDAG